MSKTGLFVGLLTLDFVYLSETTPNPNQKIVAHDYVVSAGGPATNAAVTFSQFSNQARLLSVLGCHPVTSLIQADLDKYGVEITDMDAGWTEPPPISSIIVTQSTGERAIISINSKKCKISQQQLPENLLQNAEIILIDGHQMEAGKKAAQLASAQQIPVVIDGGSWKAGFEEILTKVDYAICSSNFYPPECDSTEDVIAYLRQLGVKKIAITRGEKSILYVEDGEFGEIPVPKIQAVDTLGAGDIFHGAFCSYILKENFTGALAAAAKIAANSCRFLGTRGWIDGK
jgi:sugar/nucleoside kinase (ribokinase family)